VRRQRQKHRLWGVPLRSLRVHCAAPWAAAQSGQAALAGLTHLLLQRQRLMPIRLLNFAPEYTTYPWEDRMC